MLPTLSPDRIALPRTASESIRVARVLCIFFMVTVHFWPGDGRIRDADAPAALHAFYILVIDYLGRSSVPLLSIVSGVLLTVAFAGRARPGDATTMIRQKARALLVPMVLWSALTLALFAVFAVLRGDYGRMPDDVMGWINAVFAVTAPPASMPLAFLRDVFLASVLAVLSLTLWRQSPFLGLALLLGVTAAEVADLSNLFLRPQILLFYVLGVLIAIAGKSGMRPGWPLVVGLIALEVVLNRILNVDEMHPVTEVVLPYLTRLAMVLLMWEAANTIRAQNGALRRLTFAIEPHVFVIFCSHVILLAIAGPFLFALGIGPAKPLFLLVFLGQLALVTGGGILISVLGWRMAPQVMAVLSGKGTAHRKRPAAVARDEETAQPA